MEWEGPSECDGRGSAPPDACSRYNNPAGGDAISVQRTQSGAGIVGLGWGSLTFSFSMARAAMCAFLKLTKAQNLSWSTRMLSISPYLRYAKQTAQC